VIAIGALIQAPYHAYRLRVGAHPTSASYSARRPFQMQDYSGGSDAVLTHLTDMQTIFDKTVSRLNHPLIFNVVGYKMR